MTQSLLEQQEYARQGLKREREAERSARQERRKRAKEEYRREWRWRKAGHPDATVERYEAMKAAQDGKCALCKQDPKKKGLVYDERGLLCTSCHVHLAWAERYADKVAHMLGLGLDKPQEDVVHFPSLTT